MLSISQATIHEVLEGLEQKGLPFSQYKIHRENDRMHILGHGSFSIVYEMEDVNCPKKRYAMKVIGFNRCTITSEKFWKTVNLQNGLSERCEYVMRNIDAAELRVILDTEGHCVKVAEKQETEYPLLLQFILMDKLEPIVQQDKFGKMTLVRESLQQERSVVHFAMQVGQAIYTLHLNHVLHRDIKLENIFWDQYEQVYKLGDFGIAKYVEKGNAETVVYTDGYGAPEIEKRLYDSYSATADVYSFGITLYLLLNQLRFPGSDGYYVNIVQYDEKFIFPAPLNASVEMTRMVRKMCSYHNKNRYQSIGEVLTELNRIKSMQPEENADIEFADVETDYYVEENAEENFLTEKEFDDLSPREQRKLVNQRYKKLSFLALLWMAILFALFFYNTQGMEENVVIWMFWLIPVALIGESIFIQLKSLHWFWGIVSALFIGYSCLFLGFTAPNIISLCSLLTGSSVIIASCGIGMILGLLFEVTNVLPRLHWFSEHNSTWVIGVLLILAVGWQLLLGLSVKQMNAGEREEGNK